MRALPNYKFFWQYVEHWSSTTPESIVITFGEHIVTYEELNALTDQLAKAFIHFGVQPGDRISTILPPCPEYVYTLIAASKVGAITVPMDVRHRISDLRAFFTHVEPRLCIAINQFRDHEIAETLQMLQSELGDTKYIVVEHSEFGTPFEELFKLDLKLDDELKIVKMSQTPEDAILIIFTGGTTGVPKATLLSHKNIVTMCLYEVEFISNTLHSRDVTGQIRTLSALPPSHIGGTLELMGAWIVGGHELIILDRWSPYPVLDVISKEKLAFILAVPTMYAIILSLPDLDQYDLSSLKVAFLSGEKVSLELLEGIQANLCDTIVVGYGSTEAGAEVTFTDPSDDLTKLAEGYVGKPFPGVELKIVDDAGNDLPSGEVGEILVRGPLTSKGYFKQPDEDVQGFSPDGFCKTGDLGYLTEDGGLFIVGRKKHIIRVGSYTVLPARIEEIAQKHPNVAMAACIGIPDKIYGEVVWLVVTPNPGAIIDEQELIKLCKRELADFQVPKKVIIRESLPQTRIGKADRIKLREEILESLK